VAGSCEHSNEPLCSINGEEFLDRQRDYHFLMKDSTSWIVG
jgi:hypothetical protein